MSLGLAPISLAEANDYVDLHHRHSVPTVGHKFSLAAIKNGQVVGVAIVGRPVARGLDDTGTLEVLRVCTEGERNACSFLYGACWRATRALGYQRLVTYTRQSEPGTSLIAAGWRVVWVKSRSVLGTPRAARVLIVTTGSRDFDGKPRDFPCLELGALPGYPTLTGGTMSTAEHARMREFVIESNRIEGITREPTEGELMAHAAFLPLRTVKVADLEGFVAEVAARPLRRAVGQDVFVGNHRPPPGGPGIEDDLRGILVDVNAGDATPYETHVAYETLHPFLDGNGRSGRVLWAWQMRNEGLDPFALPFLHRFYYQALDGALP